MKKCLVCNKDVVWEEVVSEDDFEFIFERVDYHGEMSLTDSEQLIYNGLICSSKCYRSLS